MTQGYLVCFALGAFALVVGAQLRIGMSGAKGRLEEGGSEHLDPAFAHLGVALPLAALAQARVVAHKGLESSGRLAIALGVQNLVRQKGQNLVCTNGSEAGDGFE